MSERKTRTIPVIESEVFTGGDHARFAVGVVAVGSSIVENYQQEFIGAADLRAKTYIDKGFVSESDLDEQGTELDKNDDRSVHFVILERVVAAHSLARVVGNMRLIVKDDINNADLPVESFYPDIFRQSVSVGSTEVSRLICRHEDSTIQAALKWPLFIGGVKYVLQKNLGPVYGLLEPELASSLIMQRVPVKALADARYIPDINATKQPIEVDVMKLKEIIELVGDHGVDPRGGFSYIDFGESDQTKYKQNKTRNVI
jgi:hypothetical protein